MSSSGSSRSSCTMPIANAGADALTTVSDESISTAEEEITARTWSAPGGTSGGGAGTVASRRSLKRHR